MEAQPQKEPLLTIRLAPKDEEFGKAANRVPVTFWHHMNELVANSLSICPAKVD